MRSLNLVCMAVFALIGMAWGLLLGWWVWG